MLVYQFQDVTVGDHAAHHKAMRCLRIAFSSSHHRRISASFSLSYHNSSLLTKIKAISFSTACLGLTLNFSKLLRRAALVALPL
jgi:hypothetical protein